MKINDIGSKNLLLYFYENHDTQGDVNHFEYTLRNI